MGYFGRLINSITGRDKNRIVHQLEILGAPPELIIEAKGKNEYDKERILVNFIIENKHATILDWRDSRDQIYDSLVDILSAEEKKLMPKKEQIPDNASFAIACIRRAFSESKRVVVHTESFGDFSLLFLVSREQEREFIQCVGPWLIEDKDKKLENN